MQILPDITEDRWSYNGTAAVEGGRHKGKSAHTWVWKLKNKSDYGEYDNTYTFFTDKVGFGQPVSKILYTKAPLPMICIQHRLLLPSGCEDPFCIPARHQVFAACSEQEHPHTLRPRLGMVKCCSILVWVLQDGAPLRLNMWGFNLYTDGHFDLYIADYYDYKVSPPGKP